MCEITSVVSSSQAGAALTEVYPHLQQFCSCDLDAVDPACCESKADVVFTATPAGVSDRTCAETAGCRSEGDRSVGRLSAGSAPNTNNGTVKRRLPMHICSELCTDCRKFLRRKLRAPILFPTRAVTRPQRCSGSFRRLKEGWIDPSHDYHRRQSGVSGAGRKTR